MKVQLSTYLGITSWWKSFSWLASWSRKFRWEIWFDVCIAIIISATCFFYIIMRLFNSFFFSHLDIFVSPILYYLGSITLHPAFYILSYIKVWKIKALRFFCPRCTWVLVYEYVSCLVHKCLWIFRHGELFSICMHFHPITKNHGNNSLFMFPLVWVNSRCSVFKDTVMILCFRTGSHMQTVHTQSRLLLPKQKSDQGLHCLPIHRYHLDPLHFTSYFHIRIIAANIWMSSLCCCFYLIITITLF